MFACCGHSTLFGRKRKRKAGVRQAKVARMDAAGHPGSDAIQKLLDNNRKWASYKAEADPEFFPKCAQGQSPEYLWIGCSDSRVVTNIVTGLEPGEIFTHRNVGNIVTHADLNCMSVVEYAVHHLKVKHVIVCGHYGCGACKAALSLPSASAGLVNSWISHIRDVRNQWAEELKELEGDEQARRLCQLNTVQQTFHMCTSPPIQAAWASGQELYVHGMIYDLADGALHNLLGPIASMDDLTHMEPAAECTGVSVDKDLDDKLWKQIDKVYTFERAAVA